MTEPLVDAETTTTGLKDNRCKAILAINISSIAMISMGVLYKIAAREGFHVVEYTFFRCVSALFVALAWNVIIGRNPLKHFPWKLKYTMVIRSFAGHLGFTMFNIAVPLAPLSLITVIFQTHPFWTSLIALCVLDDSIVNCEICYRVVVVLHNMRHTVA